MRNPEVPARGDVITYVDTLSVEHDALVTMYWGGDLPGGALNCVYVSKDDSEHDPYGNQLKRATSISRQSEHTAPGNYWKPKS